MNLFLLCAIAISLLLSLDYVIALCFVAICTYLLYTRAGAKMCVYALSVGLILCSYRYFLTLNGQLRQNDVEGVVVDSGKNYLLLRDGYRLFYIPLKGHVYQVGDYLQIHGNSRLVDFPLLEEAFDFTAYLNHRGCYLSLENASIISERLIWFRLKAFKENFLCSFNPETRSLVQGLIFGESIRTETGAIIQSMHVLYLFSTSGLHIHLWLLVVEKLCLLKLNKQKSQGIAYASIIPLFVFNPTSISILRIGLMYLIKQWNYRYFENRLQTLDCLSIVMLIILCIDPYSIYHLGFILGFTIATFSCLTRSFISTIHKKYQSIVRILLVFFLLIPYYLTTAYLIPLSQIVFSMIISPVIGVLFILSYGSVLLLPLPNTLNSLGEFIVFLVRELNKYTSEIIIGKPHMIAIVLLLLLTVGTLYGCEIRVKKFIIFNITIYGLVLTSICGYYAFVLPDFVAFINVGQGDSILLKQGEHAVLIDTGGSLSIDIAEEVLIPFLHHYRIFNIDALIITHQDYDHAGAAPSLKARFNIKEELKANDFPYSIGNIRMDNLNEIQNEDENRSSLVLTTKFLEKTWLFMGDAPTDVELNIQHMYPTLKADIIKIGHHGSNTSTSKDFITQVQPKEAVISCGQNNIYHHPHESVIELLTSLDIRIRRTDMEGTIFYTR